MKQKNMTLMVVAIGCGLVAAFLTARLSGGSKEETVDVLVAKKELPVGTLLDDKELENMVGTMKLPKASLTPDTIVNIEDLRGKKLNRTLKEKNPFTAGDVTADSGIKIPEGMYKYAIKIDGVKAVAGFVQPGDHVDVQLTESTPDGKARAGFVLRDVLVLAVDTASRRREGGQEAVMQVNSVSLAVSSKQSLYLSAAEKRGEVKLVLRDGKDQDRVDVEPIIKIPGIDKEKGEAPAVVAVKTISVVYAAKDVAVNTFITKDNFNDLFIVREIPEQGVVGKPITDPATLYEKYITNKMEADMPVRENWLSATKKEIEAPKTVVVEVVKDPMAKDPAEPMAKIEPVEPEMLFVQPREQPKPLYPRKFEQIINNQRHYFIETAPGEFKKVEGNGAELKDLPDAGRPEKKEEAKPETGDRAA